MTPEANPKSDSHAKGVLILELIKIGIPILTLVFGYYIWINQTYIKAKVDSNQEVLKTQMALQSALGEEFYKRRLSRYEDACRELAATEAALNKAGGTVEDETLAFDVIAKFDQLNKSNTLYWSGGLQNGLDQFWALGVEKLKDRKWDDQDVNDRISKEIAGLHTQMKTDLNLADLPTPMKQAK
jgi:phosphoenolpyruvate-protein kinase (PTS system EI component)